MITELKKGVYWVGAVDWPRKHFHGHELSTHRGSSYNSYLILDEKVVLVDTVLQSFQDELIRNISEIIDPAKIDIVVVNHCELDHSGALQAVIQHAPSATIVASTRGRESVEGHFHQSLNLKIVRTGDRIRIGENELVFIEAPMLHWPDSMFTYLTGRNILMPNDAFGQHYATAFRFNDQVDQQELYEEALKYYANILNPFSNAVAKKISELLALNLPIDTIAPSHGVIWRDDPLQIVRKYQEWAAQKPEPRAVILFDTMWNATRHMAEAIEDGLVESGVDCKLLYMPVTDRNDAIVDIFKAKALVIGSSTLNNGLLPPILTALADIKGLKFKNKIGAAFGSYGWSGEAVKLIEEHFQKCQIPVVGESLKVKWQPTKDDLDTCREYGRRIADAVKQPT